MLAAFYAGLSKPTVSPIIFTGPPGVGKTSLAGIIASSTSSDFISLSALSASVADVREAIAKAIESRRFSGRKTVLLLTNYTGLTKRNKTVF